MHNMNLLLVRLIFVDISALLLFITDIENKCVTFNQDYQRYVLLSAKKEKKRKKKSYVLQNPFTFSSFVVRTEGTYIFCLNNLPIR